MPDIDFENIEKTRLYTAGSEDLGPFSTTSQDTEHELWQHTDP